MSTKTDLHNAWTKLTGDPDSEARYRFRLMSEAALLPPRSGEIEIVHLARTLLAFTVSDSPKQIAELISQYSEMRCGYCTGGGEHELMDMPLITALCYALRSPYSLSELKISPAEKLVTLSVWKGEGGIEEYGFSDVAQLIPKQTHPIRVSKSISWDFVTKLKTELGFDTATDLLSPPNENATPGRVASRNQDHHSKIPAADTPEPTREREIPQASSSRGPGPSMKIHRSATYDEAHPHCHA